ncbi:MAG: NYN domain-containing protein [Proteobacteria bacterium]|nr:NYN domain-containing protein [Pseudomonadota bacterium]
MSDHSDAGAEASKLWLIDAGYLFNAQRSVDPGYSFDYLKLRRKLEEHGAFWRAYYLNSTSHVPSEAQEKFHSWLGVAPPRGPQLITKLYELKQVRSESAYCYECQTRVSLSCPNSEGHHLENQQQKGVDVGIATLALAHRDRYDTLMLSSGDGDLMDAVEFLSERGKRIELAVFSEGVSIDLQARADRVFWIDDFADEVRRGRPDSAPRFENRRPSRAS